ncbi:MAG: glycosyltransferase family 4 protein [Melioribacter sp.]|nr:glycosyltransferase family 4 protein [Melioribacter sp.]
MERTKKIYIAFLGNPRFDSRITNLSNSLREDGCKISVLGFDWFISKEDYSDDEIKIYSIKKSKISFFFYLQFAYILINELIRSNADIYFAEDLYTLPFVTTIAKIKKAKIVYNSREIYAHLGGLRNRPALQKIVKLIEKYFIRKVDLVLTTGPLDSKFIENLYNIKDTLVVRNIPLYQKAVSKIDLRKKYNIDPDKLILIYQGVILPGRGLKQIISAVAKLPKTVLIIFGEGEQKDNFIELANKLNISDRIIFAGSIDQKELINYTAGGDAGLSLIENISISYYHALPNKLFEYIMAGLPVLCSDLPQMKEVIEKYDVGESINMENEENISTTLKRWCENTSLLEVYKKNCETASEELNWQAEYKKVRKRLFDI